LLENALLSEVGHGLTEYLRSLGARALNAVLQRALNPDATPQVTRFGWTYAPGDKVLQTVNNYEKDVYVRPVG